MRKRSLTTLTAIALLLVLVTLVAVSGTYAKYTTTVTGTATAIVAKWNFSASHGSTKLTDQFVIDLGATATVGAVPVTVGDGEDAITTNKIQPGSKGTVTITIDNTDSDVAASLTIKATAVDGSPLTGDQFKFEEPVIKIGQDVVNSVPAGETATATVAWEWVYESTTDPDGEGAQAAVSNDALDTEVGSNDAAQAGTPITLIGLEVTGYQAAPTPTP